MWRANVSAFRLPSGTAVYARSPDGMRHLAEVGDRCLYGGLIAEGYGEGARYSEHGFDLADNEVLVSVWRMQSKPLDESCLPSPDEPDFEAIVADREHAAL